jgi:hypothetical protein
LQFTVQAGLNRWLSDVITVQALAVVSDDASLRVALSYIINRTGQERIDNFERLLSAPAAPARGGGA